MQRSVATPVPVDLRADREVLIAGQGGEQWRAGGGIALRHIAFDLWRALPGQ